MEIITGRLTANARIKQFESGHAVTNFSIAINKTLKPKGSSETKQYTRYVECSIWNRNGIAPYLTQGTEVQMFGTIDSRAYINGQGKAVSVLTFHVRELEFRSKGKAGRAAEPNLHEPANGYKPAGSADDLPF